MPPYLGAVVASLVALSASAAQPGGPAREICASPDEISTGIEPGC